MVILFTTLLAFTSTVAPASQAAIDIIRPPTATAQGYTLSLLGNGRVHVNDAHGRLLREAHIPESMANLLFSTVTAAPPLNSLSAESCDRATNSDALTPTYLRFGGIVSPNISCANEGGGFMAMLWGIVQQIIGSVGQGGKSGGLGGLGSLGGLGNLGGLLGGLGNLGGLGGLTGLGGNSSPTGGR